jgi:ribosomal-protein-alanine N-acetyltransferase
LQSDGVTSTRSIAPGERLAGQKIDLRLVTLDDCTPRYQAWLADPDINRYLETRFRPQPLPSIRQFVETMLASPHDYLFAIVESGSGLHVGNLKVGPINPHHLFADLSYFIGEKDRHGRGYAREAIALACGFAFTRLGLHRLQASLYAGNVASARALEAAGFAREGTFTAQVRTREGTWEDRLWYGLLRDGWEALRSREDKRQELTPGVRGR